jgi:chemotaxis protein CheX
MDAKLLNPFVDATLYVLETMAFTKARAGEPYEKNNQSAQGDVSGVLGLMGHQSGTISVSFSEQCILRIVSNMLGEECHEMDGEITDAVGEITNMIAGQARAKLDEIGISLTAAIPTVVLGKRHAISHVTNHCIMAVPFSTANGDFTIEVCFDQ